MATFDEYIQNPMGISNSVISNREMYRTLYMGKLDNILLRELGEIKYTLYKTKTKYYVYMKIPSEAIKKFYYDVVVEFTPPEKEDTDRTLNKYTVRFFSNDPSFVFTFAHAFIKNDMFIKDLKPLMSKEAVRKNADEKNPQNQIGYVKSLYFTYLLMKKYGLFNKIKYATAKKYDVKVISKEIMPADEKIQARQQAVIDKSMKKKRQLIAQDLKQQVERDKRKDTKSTNKIKTT